MSALFNQYVTAGANQALGQMSSFINSGQEAVTSGVQKFNTGFAALQQGFENLIQLKINLIKGAVVAATAASSEAQTVIQNCADKASQILSDLQSNTSK
jgi:phage-related protein